MPKVDLVDGSRFAVVGDRDDPGAADLPFMFDPAAVAAVEAKGEGKIALHLVGGQTILLRPHVAQGALKALGLSSAAGGAPKRRQGEEAKRRQGEEAKRRAGGQPAKLKVKAKRAYTPKPPEAQPQRGGLLPAMARLFA